MTLRTLRFPVTLTMGAGWGDKMLFENDDIEYMMDKIILITNNLKLLSEDFLKLADSIEKLEQAQRITRGILKENGLYEAIKSSENGNL